MALFALAAKPGGFTLAELAERVERSRRCRLRFYDIRILAGILVLRERVLKPVLAGLGKPRVGRPPKHVHPIDQRYQGLQHELRRTLQALGLAACG